MNDETSYEAPQVPMAQIFVSSTISNEEVQTMCGLIGSTVWNTDYCDTEQSSRLSRQDFDVQVVELDPSSIPPGATGRVLILQVGGDGVRPSCLKLTEEVTETWEMELSQQIDDLLYSKNPLISQPILVSIQSVNESSVQSSRSTSPADRISSLILSHIKDYALAESLACNHDDEQKSLPDISLQPNCFTPTGRYEVDGAMVVDGSSSVTVWDTSSILIWDNLVSDTLRELMLKVVLGHDDDMKGGPWDDVTNGPDPRRWVQGGLVDIPAEHDNKDNQGEADQSFGLTDDALEDLCIEPPPPAIQEFECILAHLFPDFIVSRLPEAVLGDFVTPLTANAPCFGQSFSYHIDADPFFAPPSPWTDIYGRYPNRNTGKPRFVSCLVYLNGEWDPLHWGAPTRFLDVATDTAVDIAAKPGRVVVMDQDITHTVVAPTAEAGPRPRYSLVWKLILHPSHHNQDMRHLADSHLGWPEPKRIGSAKR